MNAEPNDRLLNLANELGPLLERAQTIANLGPYLDDHPEMRACCIILLAIIAD